MTARPKADARAAGRLRVVRPPEDGDGGGGREKPGKGATVGEVLKAINPNDRAAIMVAFEAGNSFYIEYEPGRFVGVNTDALPQLKCEQQAGDFRLGRIVPRRGADVYREPGRKVRRQRQRGPRASGGGAGGTPPR